MYLSNLGNAYQSAYERSGEGLERAIAVQEEAVALTPTGHPNRPMYLSNLGNAYQSAYERSGEGLERAIAVQEEAVALTPTGHPSRPSRLNNLGNAYQSAYERSGEPEQLQRAIAVKEEAVALTPTGHPSRPMYLNNLGIAYQSAYERSGEPEQLQRAIAVQEEAVALTPTGHPNRPGYLSNLGIAYQSAYERSGEPEQLQRAIAVQEEAVALTPTGHPNRPGYLNNLGSAYQSAYERSGEHDDLLKAIETYQAALDGYAVGVFPMERRHAGNNLGRLLYREGRYGEARAAFEQAHEALEQLHKPKMTEQERRKLSEDNALLYARLVFCCLKESDANAALEYAAAGKGRAFVDMLGSARLDLDAILAGDLSEEYPGLQADVKEVQRLRGELDRLLTQLSQVEPGNKQLGEQLSSEVQAQQQKVEEAWQQVERTYPALAATQRAPSMSAADAKQLAEALGATLVEYYEHYEGCGAFVVTADEVRWVAVEEPQAVWKEYERWVTELKVSRYNPPYEEPLTEVWQGLYRAVFAPLVPFLSPEKPLVIAPFGWLHRIPLGVAQDEQGEYVCDRYQVSFAPSLSALWVARREQQERGLEGEEQKALVVMHPGEEQEDEDYRKLKQNLQEATKNVSQFFELRTDLYEKQAVVGEVIAKARSHSLVHFFCHGKFLEKKESIKPYGLLLEQGVLTVDHILREMVLPRMRLASLGACVSAMVDIRGGEEHVGLPWALLTARAQGVIGSLWTVDSAATGTLFHWFYLYMANGASPAEALRQAMREIRKTEGWEAPYYWGAFQSIGMVLERGYSLCRKPLSVHPPELEKGMQMTSGGIEMQDYEIFVKNAGEMLHDMSGKRWHEVKERLLSDPDKTRTLSRKLQEVIAQNEVVEYDSAMVEVVKNIFRMVYDHKPLGTLLLRPGLQLSLEDMEELDVETDSRYVADMHRGGIHNELVGLEGKIEQLLSGGLADEPTAEEPRDQPEA